MKAALDRALQEAVRRGLALPAVWNVILGAALQEQPDTPRAAELEARAVYRAHVVRQLGKEGAWYFDRSWELLEALDAGDDLAMPEAVQERMVAAREKFGPLFLSPATRG